MLVVFACLLLWDRRARGTGQLTGIFLLLYGMGRFYIESLRWYEHQMILFQAGPARLTISQVISAAMILCGVALIARSFKQPAVRVQSPAPIHPPTLQRGK